MTVFVLDDAAANTVIGDKCSHRSGLNPIDVLWRGVVDAVTLALTSENFAMRGLSPQHNGRAAKISEVSDSRPSLAGACVASSTG